MNQIAALQALAARSMLFELFCLVVGGAFLVLWFSALIHCLQFRNDGERVLWILIIALVPFGGIIYFVMGRVKCPSQLRMRHVVRNKRTQSDSLGASQIDILAMHDERKRIESINDALRVFGEANRRTKLAN